MHIRLLLPAISIILIFDNIIHYIFNFAHSIVVSLSHEKFLVPQLLVFVGLLVDPVHGVLELVDSVPHFELMLKVLRFV